LDAWQVITRTASALERGGIRHGALMLRETRKVSAKPLRETCRSTSRWVKR
jgi:hypothetical protein